MSIGDRMNDFEPEVVENLTWEEFRPILIIHYLSQGNPEALIEFMREGGDMTSFDEYGLDLIAEVLRGKKLRGPGAPKSEKVHNQNVQVLFEVAWFSEKEKLPLTDPRYTKNSAFEKASEAVGGKVKPRRAQRLWEDCTDEDRDYFRKQARD